MVMMLHERISEITDKWFLFIGRGQMKICDDGARGKLLIGDCYWNSHDYLHDSDTAVYKMKLYKDTRSENNEPHWETHIKGKTNWDLFYEEQQDNPECTHRAYGKQCTICTLGGVENWKYLTAWMQIYPYCKSLSCLCLSINNFLDADSWIKHLHKKRL